MTEDDKFIMKLWHKIFSRTDASGDHFVILPTIDKVCPSTCHSNAGVERSFSANERNVNKAKYVLK